MRLSLPFDCRFDVMRVGAVMDAQAQVPRHYSTDSIDQQQRRGDDVVASRAAAGMQQAAPANHLRPGGRQHGELQFEAQDGAP